MGGGGTGTLQPRRRGGYVEARVTAVPGETLTVRVGQGGTGAGPPSGSGVDYERAGAGGRYGGGGDGGPVAAGGGGMSSVLRESAPDGGGGAGDGIGGTAAIVVVAAAGGGGGGGATDYCCAHGGAGGGRDGGDGLEPGLSTPLSVGTDRAAGGLVRDEFTPEDCADESCVDPRDRVGMPAFHSHVDRGFAPGASYDILSTAGGGGNITARCHRDSDGGGGVAGISGSYSVDVVSRQALPGGYGLGGRGADGKEGGGGGGGGHHGRRRW